MAGEWIPVDIALDQKPEVQELIDLTGEPVEVVCFRLIKLWGWASLNSADGTARATPARLARVCGGSDDFWRAVEAVGWIEFDADAGTATIPGWGRRFSMAAKARACGNDRQKRWRNASVTVDRYATVTTGEDRRGQNPPPPREASPVSGKADRRATTPQDPPPASWEALKASWNGSLPSGDPRRWRSPNPPKGAADCLAEDGWLGRAEEAMKRLPSCRFFSDPVPLQQLCVPGFVDRVLSGQYDKPKQPPPRVAGRPDDRPPPQAWAGDDAARFEATKRRLAEQLRAEAS